MPDVHQGGPRLRGGHDHWFYGRCKRWSKIHFRKKFVTPQPVVCSTSDDEDVRRMRDFRAVTDPSRIFSFFRPEDGGSTILPFLACLKKVSCRFKFYNMASAFSLLFTIISPILTFSKWTKGDLKMLRIMTMLLSRTSLSSGYVPDCSFGRIQYFCNGLSAKTEMEKPR